MSNLDTEIQELLEKIIERVKSLPEKDRKELLEMLAEVEQSLRASGSVDIPLESKSHGHSLAASFNKGQWAVEELDESLRKHKTIQKAVEHLSPEALAFLPAWGMDIIQKRLKSERLAEIRENIEKRKREAYRKAHPGIAEEWLDFSMEKIDPIEKYGIHPNAISKSLKKMASEPFYVRKRSPTAWGRGRKIGEKQKRIPIIQNGKIIGYEEAQNE